MPFGVIDPTQKGTQWGTSNPPKFFCSKIHLYNQSDAKKFAKFNGYHYFWNPTIIGPIYGVDGSTVGGWQKLDPLKCRNYRKNAARWNTNWQIRHTIAATATTDYYDPDLHRRGHYKMRRCVCPSVTCLDLTGERKGLGSPKLAVWITQVLREHIFRGKKVRGRPKVISCPEREGIRTSNLVHAVSYTHLTLPTIYSV